MERRHFVRALGVGTAGAAVAALTPGLDAEAKRPPHGRPFKQLQRQIDELREEVEELGEEVEEVSEGNFEELRVVNPDPDEASRLLFGTGEDCSIGIDPAGGARGRARIAGLLLNDPEGIRILNPDDAGDPTLRFGTSDLCTIFARPGDGITIQDPFGLALENPNAGQASQLIFGGADSECRILGGVLGDGIAIQDPFGLSIQNPNADQASQLTFGGADSECRIRAAGPGGPTGAGGGMAFEDPFGFQFENPALVNGAVVNVDGQVQANEFVQTSSAAFKENVVPLDDALASIERLEGVRFDWNADRGGAPSIGFIAEDVAEVFPELVSREADGRVKGLAYSNLVAVAVEGIKAQQKQIQELESEKASMDEELRALRSQLEDVSAQVQQLVSKT